jgi:hypothetical protein
VGGIANFLLLFFSMTMGPFAKHSFITKAFSKFYLAKTKDNNLFKDKSNLSILQKLLCKTKK